MLKEKAIEAMKNYYSNDSKQICHTLKVLKYAEQIYIGDLFTLESSYLDLLSEDVTNQPPINTEKLEKSCIYLTLVLSCIFHDIGIPEALRKYNSSAPKYQELEGPAVARALINNISSNENPINSYITERVCYIVGNHHTKDKIDSIDFQILWEADLIVNIQEGWTGINVEALKKDISRHFKTNTGKKIISSIL